MSDHHHHDNSSGFLNGLIIGAVLGAGIVFFLQTKKGKEIAKELSEKGLILLENFDDVVAELEEDAVDEQKQSTYLAVAEDITTKQTPPSHIETLQAHGRRFFHGIPKRR